MWLEEVDQDFHAFQSVNFIIQLKNKLFLSLLSYLLPYLLNLEIEKLKVREEQNFVELILLSFFNH